MLSEALWSVKFHQCRLMTEMFFCAATLPVKAN
jgi:hypothetical protein